MDFIEVIKIIIIGVLQGITEWLPISSTGHMILVDEFLKLNFSPEFMEMFLVVIQLGSIFAVVVLFWEKIFPFSFKEGFHAKTDVLIMWGKIIIACIPAMVVGLLFDDWVNKTFYNPQVVALALILYGIFFILIEKRNKKKEPQIKTQADITFAIAFLIGVFQMLSIVPGTSRSGSTILGGILLGSSRTIAAEFSFFLAIPAMFGASALKVAGFLADGGSFTTGQLSALILAMAVAFGVSAAVIRFLMNYIKNKSFTVFGWYRIVLGAAVLIYFYFIK
ncbi:MAG: undecaprenyl-diphosphate phosphatase [Clostridiales bacterium]|nr:undecaprenyl-diphosphate phosphatase [Clostridiales bacterium]